MKHLEKDWLTSGLIDFEYKKYVLLAYLQEVKGNFDNVKLYPYLSDLVFHYQNLLSVKNNKKLIYENFPKEISKADFETLNIHYKRMVKDADLMQELEEIISFALPQLKNLLNEGKDIYEYIEENMEISPVGITPLRFDEGYFLMAVNGNKEMKIYEYQITIFENASEKYRGVHTQFLESVVKNLGISLESMKIELIRKYTKLPNPATYFIHSKVSCPHEETLLPVAKRLLVKYVSAAA